MFNKNYISGVYKITCLKTNKIYIGSTIDFKKRFKQHIASLNNKTHINAYLQNAWNKYGQQNFKFETIEIIKNVKTLFKKEQFWINKTKCYNHNIGFNIAKDVKNSMLGRHHTKESKLKISLSSKGRKFSKEHKEKIGRANKGRIHSKKTRSKMSKAKIGKPIPWLHTTKIRKLIAKKQIGRKHSKKTKIKISNSKKGTKLTQEHKLKLSKALIGRTRPEYVKEKIRKAHLGRSKPKSSQPGSKHGMAQIDEKIVKNILKDYKNGICYKDLMANYNISYTIVWQVVHRITWKHVKI